MKLIRKFLNQYYINHQGELLYLKGIKEAAKNLSHLEAIKRVSIADFCLKETLKVVDNLVKNLKKQERKRSRKWQ